ncbi:MAG: protein phosphatase 2C domain-containing protein [Streptosporangiaceae bacterium]
MPKLFRGGRVPAADPGDGEMAFPSPHGGTPAASRLPWRLPDEPALSGIAADAVSVGALTVRAASMVGPGHRCEEPAVPRQDAYRLGRDEAKKFLIVAVADGMSDSRRSHLGANVAVAALVGRLRTELAADVPLDAATLFLEASRQMAGTAEHHGVTEHDVRAAVLAAVIPVSSDADGGREVWLASVADVGAWLRRPAGWQRLIGEEKSGLDSGRLARFLPFHPDQAECTTVRLEPGSVLAFTTDGVGDAFAGGSGSWFAERWARPPHIASFVREVGYEADGQLDDRTAVVVWCDR